ncbi:MAG: phospholipase D-like domain-containing protein [Candidatus Woesearchaeota archaeon]
MRILVLLIVLSGCTAIPAYNGQATLYTCPEDNCTAVFMDFAQEDSVCAFYDLDEPVLSLSFSNSGTSIIVDEDNPSGKWPVIHWPGLMHHKFCTNGTHVLTGTTNPTDNGLNSNRNLVLVFDDPYLAKDYKDEFDAISSGAKGNTKYPVILHNNATLQVFFCPRDNCEENVIKILQSANHSIRFTQFSFTSKAIGNALIEEHNSGINITGIFDPRISSYSQYSRLKDAGLNVSIYRGKGKLHAKVFIVDDSILITGSFNPTASGDHRNRENVVVLRELGVVRGAVAWYDMVAAEAS